MKSVTVLVLTSLTLTLAACNNPVPDRTASMPPGDATPGVETNATPQFSSIVPPTPAERGPQADANASVPDAERALPAAEAKARSLPPTKGGAPQDVAVDVRAQEAAAKAPDTASGDAAKKAVLASGQG